MPRPHIDNFDAVAFDFDGTLVNTVAGHNIARREAFLKMAEMTGDERYVNIDEAVHREAHLNGSNPYDIIGWVLKKAGIVPEQANNYENDTICYAVDLKTEYYREKASENFAPIPASIPTLKRIWQKKEGQVAIVTTEHRDLVVPYLERQNLLDYFSDGLIITREDAPYFKPHPQAYLIALGRLGLRDNPERLLVIEDTPQGITSAKRAGATAIAIETTHSAEAFTAKDAQYPPDKIVKDYLHLSNTLQV